MNANAKEWHPPTPIASTSMVSCSVNNDAKHDTVKHCNESCSHKTTANHKTRRRHHNRTRQHRYGKKNVNGQCQNGDTSSTSDNNNTNAKEIYPNDNSTQTSIADGMISPSIQDVHQSNSTQNHISKHQEHQKQKQRRRRRRKGGSADKNTDNVNISSKSNVVDGGGRSHHTQKVANHKRRHHKKKVNGIATSEKHPDDELRLDNECNFPTLTTNSNAPSTAKSTAIDTNWNDSLANKISIEIEEQKKQKYLEEQLQLEEDMKKSVQLTKLTYNKPLHNILDEEVEERY